jgi:hypothetical protein
LLGELDDLALGDSADMIQMEPALAFGLFGIDARAHKSKHDQGDSQDAAHAQRKH